MIAPASTGKDRRSKIAVIITDQTNNGICSNPIDFTFRFIIVVIKLIAPRIDETPAKCREKIAMSTAIPPWNICVDSGGYTVHPVPTPPSTIEDNKSRDSDGGSNQNLMLFIRGNAISGAPSIMGTNQLPKPPIIIGITIKKIMTNACAVTIELYVCSLCLITLG